MDDESGHRPVGVIGCQARAAVATVFEPGSPQDRRRRAVELRVVVGMQVEAIAGELLRLQSDA